MKLYGLRSKAARRTSFLEVKLNLFYLSIQTGRCEKASVFEEENVRDHVFVRTQCIAGHAYVERGGGTRKGGVGFALKVRLSKMTFQRPS